MTLKSISNIDVSGKTLLTRVDYNVPLDGETITDDNRIRASLPTLEMALEKGAAIILCMHLGKPKGKVVPELSVKPLAKRLSELISMEVKLAPDCVGDEVEAMAKALKPGQVLMLENLRFHPEETSKDDAERREFGRKLASYGDIYVNDAFGVAHRKNASVTEAPLFSDECCAGLLLEKEWEYLEEALREPKRPYLAVSGGAKVSSKLSVLTNLLGKVDDLIIGGAMANTFMLAKGHDMKASLVEEDLVEEAKKIMADAEGKGTKLHLPVDFVYAGGIKDDKAEGVCGPESVPDGKMVLDIGPETIKLFCEVVAKAKTVVWNGPMGAFENPAFAAGSNEVSLAIADSDCMSIVGGGDTDHLIHKLDLVDKLSFISTGGGSFLESLEGKELPAFTALKECMEK